VIVAPVEGSITSKVAPDDDADRLPPMLISGGVSIHFVTSGNTSTAAIDLLFIVFGAALLDLTGALRLSAAPRTPHPARFAAPGRKELEHRGRGEVCL
jgi:hypothetical protein